MIARLCLFVLFAVGMPALAGAFDANGNEDRCAELGANCICSEPMNGTLVKMQDFVFGFADTTSGGKQCTDQLVTGAVYETDVADGNLTSVTSSTEATMFAAIPSGHSVTRVAKSPTGDSTGAFGTRMDGQETGRRGIRFYRYWDPTYALGDAACHNASKIFQLGFTDAFSAGPLFQVKGGNVDYAWQNVTTDYGWASNAPNGGGYGEGDPLPGQSGSLANASSYRGKWVRFEVYFNNTTNSGTTSFEWYMTNVTDDLPTVTVTNTNGFAPMSGIHMEGSPPTLRFYGSNNFRNAGGGTGCTGFNAHWGFLAAAWSTNAGQMIGAASEFEGGGAAPSGGTLALFLRGLALVHIGATGFLMWERRLHARFLYETGKELVARWRWQRAVKRWLATAPLRLSPPVPSITVPTIQTQASVSRHDGVTP